MTPFQIVAFGLATGSGMAYLWVAANNWRVLVTRIRRDGSRESMVFLAGPVLVGLLVQALWLAGAPLTGRQLAAVGLAGLALDPAALPAFLFALWRWAGRRLR